jgi:hypothetical protein
MILPTGFFSPGDAALADRISHPPMRRGLFFYSARGERKFLPASKIPHFPRGGRDTTEPRERLLMLLQLATDWRGQNL